MEIKLNLASKPYLNRQGTRLWLLLVCGLLAVLLVFNGFYGYQNYQQLSSLEGRFQELEEQVAGVQKVPQGYTPEKHAKVKNEIALVNEIASADQFHWTALLSRFEELLPAEASISAIQPDFTRNSILLNCVAKDVSTMTRFVDNLLTSEDFSQAYLQRHADVEANQVAFSLEIREAF